MWQPETHFYEFGPFRIGKAERLLRRGTEVIPLPPKAVETLLALVERGGQAVDKDELLKRVWPDSFVEEGSLSRNVFMLRKALGQDHEGKPYITTVHTRGYRFLASVKEIGQDGFSGRSLAVLPLENLSGDPGQDFFADGMTDELIGQLMKIEALRVFSRTSVMRYKGVNKPLRDIARELNAALIVEGAVLHSDGRVRISARVIDGAAEDQLWAETYERDMRDVLTLQSEVAIEIARQIRVRVTTPEQKRLNQSRPIHPEAYETYLRGRYFWNKRTPQDLQRATGYFQQSIDLDPDYAPAHAGLADSYALLGSIGYDVMPPREAMPLAKAAATIALQLDDTLAEAHASLGYVKFSYDWDPVGAEEEFKRCIELNPSYAIGHHWYAHQLLAAGRVDEGTQEMRRALELDPLSLPSNLGLAWAFSCARKFDQAVQQYRKTLELAPHVPLAWYELGLAYQSLDLRDEAAAAFRQAHQLSAEESAAVLLLGHEHAILGNTKEARRQLEVLEDLAGSRYVPAVYGVSLCVVLGDLDQAFEWLLKACEERSNSMAYLKLAPHFDPLRADRRYRELLIRAGLEP